MTDYTSVKVPTKLAEIIRNSETYKLYAYRSVSEFVVEVARRVAEKGKY